VRGLAGETSRQAQQFHRIGSETIVYEVALYWRSASWAPQGRYRVRRQFLTGGNDNLDGAFSFPNAVAKRVGAGPWSGNSPLMHSRALSAPLI